MSSKPTTERSSGTRSPASPGRGEHTRRLNVGRCEHRGGAVGLGEQLFGEPLSDGAIVAAVSNQSGVTRDSRSFENVDVALLALCGSRKAERVIGRFTEKRNALVSEFEQVPRGDAAALHVVGDDHGHAVTSRVDEHDRHTRVDHSCELGGRRRQRHDQQTVGSIAPREGRKMLVTVRRRLDVEQHEVVGMVVQRGDDPSQPFDRRGVGEERDEDAKGVATTARQALGRAGWVGSRAPPSPRTRVRASPHSASGCCSAPARPCPRRRPRMRLRR